MSVRAMSLALAHGHRSRRAFSMRKLTGLVLVSAFGLAAQVPQISSSTEFMNTRTAVNTALVYLDTYKVRFMGTWASGTTYGQNDLVIYSGASYLSVGGGNVGNTPSNVSIYWTQLPGGGSGGGVWGTITGLLSAQTDLAAALAAKQASITTGSTGQYFKGDLSLGTFPTNLNQFTNGPGFLTANQSITITGACGGSGTTSISLTCAYSSLNGIPSTFAPSAHAASHAAVGSDPLTLSESQVTNLTLDLASKQAALGFTPENAANKDAVSGYAGLDTGGKLKTAEAPTWNQNTTGTAASTPSIVEPCTVPTGVTVTANTLVKADTSSTAVPCQVIPTLTTDTAWHGVAQSTVTGPGTVMVTTSGLAQVLLDSGTATIGNSVQLSTTNAGYAHDSGVTRNGIPITSSSASIRSACTTSCAATLIWVRVTPAERGAQIPGSPVTIATSGPVTVTAGGFYFNNATSGGMTFNLPVITSGTVGAQFCFGNSTTKTGAITLQAPASTYIDNGGTNGSSAGTFVSAGALGDAACVVAVTVTQYKVYPSLGAWVNN